MELRHQADGTVTIPAVAGRTVVISLAGTTHRVDGLFEVPAEAVAEAVVRKRRGPIPRGSVGRGRLARPGVR